MLRELVNHNDDIRRLLEKGYALAFDSNYLVIRDIPYLNGRGELQTGAIVTKLVFVDNERVIQEDHQIFFGGSPPYNLDGSPVLNLGEGPTQLGLSEACNDVVVERSFSNKPRDTENSRTSSRRSRAMWRKYQGRQTLPGLYEELKESRRQLVRDIHGELLKIRAVYQKLYEPVQKMVAASAAFTKEPLDLDFDAGLSASRFKDGFLEYIHRNRIGTSYGEEESRKALEKLVNARDFNVTEDVVKFLDDLMTSLTSVDRNGTPEAVTIQSQLKDANKINDLSDFLFGLKYLEMRYALKLGGKDIAQLSSGEKGALLLVFYLLLDPEEIPIIIDQPEQNLDNESVVKLLVDCIRQARSRRQVVIVTHNPNLAVVCDADQVISCKIDKVNGNKVTYECGAIEDQPLNEAAVNVLEGTYPAFDNRRKKYHKPLPT